MSVVTPFGEQDLAQGSLLVGRSPECDVVVDDPLVSRQHARLVIEEGRVWVEDLHSTNGVYVNGAIAQHRAALCEGDRILVGTCEISIFARRASTNTAPPRPDARSVSTLPPPRARSAPGPLLPLPARVPSVDPVPTTKRAESLRIIGRLAARLAAEGDLDEAERVVSGHLKRILEGAGADLTVSEELLQLACEQAFDLARWTTRGAWLDYVVELHLATRSVMSLQVIASMQGAQRWVGEFNRLLLAYYVESLTGRIDQLQLDERRRLPLLRKLVG